MIRFVTTNEGKFQEVSSALRELGIEVQWLNRSYPEIQADGLEDVVRYGMEALANEVEGDLLVDDSGLFVEALDGFPGVYSSHAYRTIGVRGLLCLLDGTEDRKARFETALGLRYRGAFHGLRGECRGAIAPEPRGVNGFGFDPIFVPEGDSRTFAEMGPDEKNARSHRGNAVRALAAFLAGREP